jgi:alpha-1,2-mannosyltransferase
LLLCFAPAVETLYMGQVNAIVLALLLTAIWQSTRERSLTSGFCLSVAIALKSSPAILLLSFLVLRRWRVVTAALFFLLLQTVLPALLWQTRLVTWYGELLLQLNREIHTGPFNLSPVALIQRALWPEHPLVVAGVQTLYYLIPAAALIFLLLLIRRQLRRHSSSKAQVEVHALFMTLMVIASPLLWYHHALFLLLPIVLLLVEEQRKQSTGLLLLFAIQAERIVAHFLWPGLLYAAAMLLLFILCLLALAWHFHGHK